MSDFHVDPEVLSTVSAKLAAAAALVDGVPEAPPAPQAGDCTAAINYGLANLCRKTDSLSPGFTAARGEADTTLAEYRAGDDPSAYGR
jgi:hypothetical protein